jgi:hypothetical protein
MMSRGSSLFAAITLQEISMLRSIRSVALCALAAVFSAPANAQSVPYDSSFSGVELRWNRSGSTSVFYSLREADGQTLVCGFYFSDGPVPDADARTLLRNSRIKANRVTVMNNLSHFTLIEANTQPSKVRAACKPGRRAWQAGFAQANVRLLPPRGGFQ